MKSQLKQVLVKLQPEVLGLKNIDIQSMKKLGMGEANLNYLVQISNKKFICRVNIEKEFPWKSKKEYAMLKLVEPLHVAPKVYYLHQANKTFPESFIIISYSEGKAWRMKKAGYTTKEIKELALILAHLHLQQPKQLTKKAYSYTSRTAEATGYIKKINTYTKNKYKHFFHDVHQSIQHIIPKKEQHSFGLTHGDLCPQNVLQTKQGLKLIDWESLELSDPAMDIANLLIDMKFKEKHMGLFLQTYLQHRKDRTILERAQIYAMLLMYHYFLWELSVAYQLIKGELHEAYAQQTTAESHIYEAKLHFHNCVKAGLIPKKWHNFNLNKLF